MAVKITAFEAENVKRIKAVQLKPSKSGLTVIGGRNNQGKTSVLDAIAWALGGDRKKPANAKRDGSVNDPKLRVELSNGIIVERKGKNSSLYVSDPSGNKAGQKLLDSLIDQLALDLPKFLNQTDREKADTLLRIIGVGDALTKLDLELDRLENQRLEIGRIARQKRGAAEELPFYAEAPADEISATELIERHQAILRHNAENRALRDKVKALRAESESISDQLEKLNAHIEDLESQRDALIIKHAHSIDDLAQAKAATEGLTDEPTDEIAADIERIDETNERIRANRRRQLAIEDAEAMEAEYRGLDDAIESKRGERRALLDGAEMPLDGLSVDGGALTYNGQPWDNMSGSDRLKVATAIVRRLKPECGFVLVDKLEQMDTETLSEFGEWAQAGGLQVIGTRVATDDSCTIIIEDGYARQPDQLASPATAQPDADAAQPIFNFPKLSMGA